MIKKIKNLLNTKSELHQLLEKSSLSKDNYVFKQEDVDNVLSYMIEENNIHQFFDFFSHQNLQTYTIKMKMLISTHQIANISEQFSHIFTNIKLSNFFIIQNQDRTNEIWLLNNIQIPYLQYLQKLTINIEDIKNYRTYLFQKQVLNNNLMIDSFKLANIVNVALSFVSNLKQALQNYPYDFLLKKVALSLYSEIQTFQRQLINSLNILFHENSNASKVEILEFLREVQAIEQRMLKFYSFHKLYDPSNTLLPPLSLKIDKDSELYLEQIAKQERNYKLMARELKTNREREKKKYNIKNKPTTTNHKSCVQFSFPTISQIIEEDQIQQKQ